MYNIPIMRNSCKILNSKHTIMTYSQPYEPMPVIHNMQDNCLQITIEKLSSQQL